MIGLAAEDKQASLLGQFIVFSFDGCHGHVEMNAKSQIHCTPAQRSARHWPQRSHILAPARPSEPLHQANSIFLTRSCFIQFVNAHVRSAWLS
mmetsp:Transcript_44419/g.110524  ORF Transcript_44419/g.110524 Transcript_44419/m.110524 type:complete len:93 (-) Transcript_44419:783-1061(-)